MKVLIVGSYGMILGNLVARLNREKCDVYVLTGNRKNEKKGDMPKHITFSFQEDSADVKYVMQGVMPDYVIFTGAWDENYQWEQEECASAYNSAVVNILSWAKEYRVPKVCYLSCMDAGKDEGTRGKLVRNGEKICETYAGEGFSVTALRFPYVYGASVRPEDTLDLLSEQCFLAKGGKDYSLPTGEFAPIYVTDLAEAVFRVGKEEVQTGGFSCYTVKGKEILDGPGFEGHINQMYTETSKRVTGNIRLTDMESVENDDFENDYGYYPRIDIETGLGRIDAFLYKNYKKIEAIRQEQQEDIEREKKIRVKNQIRMGLKKIKRVLENLLIFAIAFGVQYYVDAHVPALSGIDFLLLYIILIATQRGVGESILAVILSTLGVLWLELDKGGTVSSVLTQYDFVAKFLFYFVVGLGIAYSFLRNRIRLKERVEQLAELEDEYTRIIDINRTNVDIKKTFEDRLLNYGDSIGKIYNVVSELDILEVDKIMMAALRVVSKIMGVRDVSIYCSGTDDYYHFVGATTKEIGGQKTILLGEYKEMAEVLLDGDIYINRGIGKDLPRMAAPIFSGNRLIYIIMLWNMEFEDLNLYKKNLFLVLVKIITSSLEKGYQYEKVGRNQEYYENTDIMLPEAFALKVSEQLEGKTRQDAEYALLQVESEGKSLAQLNAELGRLLRDSDRIGYLKEKDSYLYVLVHTNYDDADFVVRKLQREGFTSKVVMLDELQ